MEFIFARLKFPSSVILVFALLICLGEFRSEAQSLLPKEEVRTLQQISSKLKNKYWNDTLTQTSCDRNGADFYKVIAEGIFSNVTCDCTFNSSTVCHVTNIMLKGLNLSGVLPEEFGDLPNLQGIDLTRNYLNGSIPTSLVRLPLVSLSMLGNRISGSIPKEIGDIRTLEELVLEDNQLGGRIPPELGNLSRLRRFLITANNFTGPLPDTFGNLKNLSDLRIDGNGISGKMPSFIGNWTKIKRLDMQGTLMEGPFPSTISLLKNLTDLRVSDLNGSNLSFPDLQDMSAMKELVLRNCSIIGTFPDYLGTVMTKLKTLDLSFNRLAGEIPATSGGLSNQLDYMYLTNNMLSGAIPSWILDTKNKYDVSYNNFTVSSTSSCQLPNVNLVASTLSEDKSISWCLKKDLPCSKKATYYSLFINCGGERLSVNGEEYEQDLSAAGPSFFFSSSEKWAFSSTGDFLGEAEAKYVASIPTGNNTTQNVYSTARLAPLSLKYYGLCLREGSYTVKLHFSEIMYTDDQTFSSTGKRIFDISIQGKRVLKDFNIAEKAGGVGKEYTETFNDVRVNGSTLEIHLYWSGKGTTAIPDRGVYGPLISAITVTPNFDPHTGLSVGAIVGIVVASCAVIFLILLFLWWKGYLGGKDLENKELRGLELQTGYFTLRQIKAATGNFNSSNKIGEGGFGPVYKGILPDGSIIAVKQLSSKSKQGNREFVNEIGMISALQHPNLVKLFGCCIEGNQLLLIYEYLENNSLARALFGREEYRLNLDWRTRSKICMGIAKGLTYLHEESRLKIVHRDIKATNVLLDKDLNAKISDFGLAKLDEEEDTHISTRIAGTVGYMAPEYAMRGYLTDKADVYSFGIVALEIVSGKSNTNYRPKEEFVYLLDWAYVLHEQGNLLDLVDPILGANYSQEEALRMLNLALLCSNPSPTLRPKMSSVVSMLEGHIPIQAPIVKQNSNNRDIKFKAFEKLSQDSQTQVSSCSQDSRIQGSVSMDGPWIDSSTSFQSKEEVREHSSTRKLLPDLYDVNLN